MLNKAMLIGRLGRDPETRHTQNGTAVCNFSLATDEKRGEEKTTEWHQIVVWDKLAEICERYLHKGKLVYIEGRIQTREWDDRDGNKRRTTEIVAREMRMLGGRDEEGSGTAREAVIEPPAPGTGGSVGAYIADDDDIPFAWIFALIGGGALWSAVSGVLNMAQISL